MVLRPADLQRDVMLRARARTEAIKAEVAAQHARDLEAFELARAQSLWAQRTLRAGAAPRRRSNG